MNPFAHTVASLVAAGGPNLGGRPFKSTPAERAEILRLVDAGGMSQSAIAARLGLARHNVADVLRRRARTDPKSPAQSR